MIRICLLGWYRQEIHIMEVVLPVGYFNLRNNIAAIKNFILLSDCLRLLRLRSADTAYTLLEFITSSQ
jgi:hypothetical protein